MAIRRSTILFAAVLALLVGTVPVGAQASAWTAWIREIETGRLILVDESGRTLNDVTLPSGIGGPESLTGGVAFSHSGRLLAYTAQEAAAPGGYRLTVYDVTTRTTVAYYDPPPYMVDSLTFSHSEHIFNEDDTMLAYGYIFPAGGWEIIILDLRTGETIGLRSDDVLATQSGLPGGAAAYFIPMPLFFQETAISFVLIPAGTEGSYGYDSFTWDMLLGSLIARNEAYLSPQSDIFVPTGEVLTALNDSRLDNTSTDFAYGQSNAIHVYDPAVGGRFPFYNDVDFANYNVRFVENGNRVFTCQAEPGMGMESEIERPEETCLVLRRSGERFGMLDGFAPDSIGSVRGLFDGFIFTTNPQPDISQVPALYYVNTTDGLTPGEAQTLWTGTPDVRAEIVWASDLRLTADAANVGWEQLADPVFDGGQETSIPATSGGVLTVGGQATVHTTEGDPLNVRGGPGRGYAIVTRVTDGMVVTVLEGPVSADGFNWWRLRAPDGIEGWAVDNADGVQTLVP